MKTTRALNPGTINILCGDPQRHQRQHSYESPTHEPLPEPVENTFWGKVKKFFRKVSEVIEPITIAIVNVTGLIMSAVATKKAVHKFREKSCDKRDKKDRKKSGKKSTAKSNTHFNISINSMMVFV